jgi:hypothetical protein
MELTGKPAQEFLLVHAVLERFASVNEDHGNFVVKLAAEFVVGVDVDFAPDESSAAGELGETLLNHFAEMTAFAGVNHHAARLWHAASILTPKIGPFPDLKLKVC